MIFLGVSVSTYLQINEQRKAEKRQRVAKFRYRAREGQDLYDQFYEVPIGRDARISIMQYIIQNLSKALEIDPSQKDVRQSLNYLTSKIKEPEAPADKSRHALSNNAQELIALMGKLRKLMHYLHRLSKIPGIDSSIANKGLHSIRLLYLELQTQSFVVVGKMAMSESKWGLAKQHFDSAKKVLLQQNITSSKTQAVLEELNQLLDDIKSRKKEETNILSKQFEEENADEREKDTLFQPKKKW